MEMWFVLEDRDTKTGGKGERDLYQNVDSERMRECVGERESEKEREVRDVCVCVGGWVSGGGKRSWQVNNKFYYDFCAVYS